MPLCITYCTSSMTSGYFLVVVFFNSYCKSDTKLIKYLPQKLIMLTYPSNLTAKIKGTG